MNVEPARCVVVEDSRYGVQAARRAGMRILAFAGGLTRTNLLEGPAPLSFTICASCQNLSRITA
jgi:beta-phosphoglucomutase-like phosphatase (HAD superfamily)